MSGCSKARAAAVGSSASRAAEMTAKPCALGSWEARSGVMPPSARAGQGRASAFPDGAIGAARFLLELMARRGIPLSAGQWISTGAVTGVHDAEPGQKVEAWFGDEHHLACRLIAEKGQ